MLLPFQLPPVWERTVHSVNCTCLWWALVKFCVCPFFPFGIESGMWHVIVLIPDNCLSIYLSPFFIRFKSCLQKRLFIPLWMSISF